LAPARRFVIRILFRLGQWAYRGEQFARMLE
jgi:hypothetical protein